MISNGLGEVVSGGCEYPGALVYMAQEEAEPVVVTFVVDGTVHREVLTVSGAMVGVNIVKLEVPA